MLQMTKKIFILFLVCLIAGCSAYRNQRFITSRDKDYLTAQSIPPLRIPPGIASSTITNEYPIPDRNYSECSKVVDLTPPELNRAAAPCPTPVRSQSIRTLSAAEPQKTTTQLVANNPPQENKVLNYFDRFTRGATNFITRKNNTNTQAAEAPKPAQETQIAKNNTVNAAANQTTTAQATQLNKKMTFSSYFDNYTRRS